MPELRPRAVVVEDDAETRRFVVRALEEEGLEVRSASRAESARALLLESGADVVILDVGLPGTSGVELCGEIRREGLDVPILMLTARSDVASRVEGLEAGADDYLGKPFALAELKARVRALLRRVRPGISESVLQLVRARGGVVPREVLLEDVWGRETPEAAASLEVIISRLRRKLPRTDGSSLVRNVRGVGYALDEDGR